MVRVIGWIFKSKAVIKVTVLIIVMFFVVVTTFSQTSPEVNKMEQLKEQSPLMGKRICIDPGHGGSETGAVGVNGLNEKDVNLKVCKMLKEMLEKEGAIVFMTREDDKSVSLKERWELNKSHNSDLFVSIHHNANSQIDRTVNRIEVFYHWYDRMGPSEDAAYLVYRELQAAFNLPNSKPYMCWSYGVLRENMYPAVLGEASYISNPQAEERLRDEKNLHAEAEAYFRGVKAFFNGGKPEIEIDKEIDISSRRNFQAKLLPSGNSALVDPQRLRVDLDGEPLQSIYYQPTSGLLVGLLPKEGIKGKHTLTTSAHNLAGHNSFVQRTEIDFDKPYQLPEQSSKIKFIDRDKLVPFSKSVDKDQEVKTIQITESFGIKTKRKVVGISSSKEQTTPIHYAKIFGAEIFDSLTTTDENGNVELYITSPQHSEPFFISANGYWSKEENLSKSEDFVLQPMFRNVLNNKLIVVDAEGGGDYPVAIGPKGLRASDANLETALYLADYLKLCGANPQMTRKIDMSMDNVSRIRFGLEHNTDIFLTIGHRLPEAGMGEKPGTNVSRIGFRWGDSKEIGQSIIFNLRQMLGTGKGLGDVTSRQPLPSEMHDWSSWEIMHGSQNYNCLYVCPQMFDAPGVEDRISTTAGCRKEALAILYGLINFYGLDDQKMALIEGVVLDSKTKTPLKDALIWLDNTLVTQTETDGKFLFKFLEPGKRTLSVMCKDYTTTKKELELKEGEQVNIKLEL